MPRSTNQFLTLIRNSITDPLLRQNTALRVRTVLEAFAKDYFNKETDTLNINQVSGLQDILDQFGVGFAAIMADDSLIPDVDLLTQNQFNDWLIEYLRQFLDGIKAPDAPTEGLVDDIGNTFSAKLVAGYSAITDYIAFTPKQPSPFPLSGATGYILNGRVYLKDITYGAAIGQIGLAVASSGSRPSSPFLLNDKVFTGPAVTPQEPGTGTDIEFDGNRPIKSQPQIGQNLGAATLAEWVEKAFFAFLEATVGLSGGGTYELGTTANVTIKGTYAANDEKEPVTGIVVNGINALPFDSAQSVTANTTFHLQAQVANNGTPKQITAETTVSFIKPLLFGALPANPSAAQVKGLGGRIISGPGTYSMVITAAGNRLTISVPSELTVTSIKDPDNGQILSSFGNPIAQNLPFAGYADQGYRTYQNNADFTAQSYNLTVTVA
jgi:hypothetical protein